MKAILIADDEESIRYTFSEFLADDGYSVDCAETLSQCIKKLQMSSYDLVFLDMHLGPDNSLDFIQELKTIHPQCAFIIITGKLDSTAMTKARKLGAIDYLVKPIRQPSLRYIAQKALNRQMAASE